MNSSDLIKYAKLILTDLLSGQSCAEFIALRIDLSDKKTNKIIQLLLEKNYITPVIVNDFTAYRLTSKGKRESELFSKKKELKK